MTDIPTVNYTTKFFLQQELSLVNNRNSLSMMLVINSFNCMTRDLT